MVGLVLAVAITSGGAAHLQHVGVLPSLHTLVVRVGGMVEAGLFGEWGKRTG